MRLNLTFSKADPKKDMRHNLTSPSHVGTKMEQWNNCFFATCMKLVDPQVLSVLLLHYMYIIFGNDIENPSNADDN